MSVGDWLNSVILDSAADDDHPPHQQAYHDPYAPPSYRAAPHRPQHGRDAVIEQVAAINHQLAGLTQGFESLIRSSSGSRNNGSEYDGTARRLADAITRLDQRVEHLAQEGRNASKALERRVESVDRALSSLGRSRMQADNYASGMDLAVAEITQRQHELDGDPYGFRRQSTPPPRVQEDYVQINDRLRSITEQIDSLGTGRVHEAIAALRNDLADIVRGLTEASPRRAIEALEGEVRVLATRLDMRSGGGAAFGKLEQGLAEVRDTLRTLTPAENLTGVVDAIRAVSQRLDQIAVGAADPSSMQQLEGAISGLREILSHVASRDALAALTDEVRALAARIESAPASRDNDVLRTLEQRIATIADAIESVRASGVNAASPDIDGMVRTLGDKIERLHAASNDHPALAQLDDRIGQLVRKLDASEQRLGNIDAIERGMKELLAYLASTRGGQQPAQQQPPVAAIERDVRRAEQSIEAVHGTIGDVVDRLAMIETGIRGGPQGASQQPARPAGSAAAAGYHAMPVVQSPPLQAPQPHVHAVAASAPQPAAARAPQQPPQMARPAVAQMRPAADGTLPYDFPLEPGSGKPRPGMAAPAPSLGNASGGGIAGMGSPAERIARSKAALGPARTAPTDAEQKSNFVLAARRAAQFAAESPAAPIAGEAGLEVASAAARPSLIRRVGRFAKPVLLGACVIVLLAAAIHMGVGYFMGGDPAPEAPKPQSKAPPSANVARMATPAPASPPLLDMGGSASTVQGGSGVLAPVATTPMTPSPAIPVAPVASAPATQPAPAPRTIEIPAAPPPPPQAAISLAPPEVTGSITARKLPLSPPPAELFPTPQGARVGSLPPAIGSKTLVSSAEAGDAAAAYEVAIRYLEGRGVPVSTEEAAVWFERASRKGLTQALFRLGGLYEKGTGVKKDLNRARALYFEAAERGHAKAMHNLAVLYAEGIDGKPDYVTAVKWFHKAASRGVADSQFNLGVLFARGIGMEQNLAESYRWFSLAAQAGDNDAAQKRDDVGKRLDAQTITAIRASLQKWTAEPQPDEATAVHAPPGGWDPGAPPAPKAKSKRAQAGSARSL
jgi:localization factor PodJL